MRILSYSPSIEVYAAVSVEGGVSYYDLSRDVTKATVTRLVDGASKFTVHLDNSRGKYDNLFSPMDRLKVLMSKDGDMIPIITGYINDAPKMALYERSVSISGKCSIYRLQQLYWDPNLRTSRELMGYGESSASWDLVLSRLLGKICGYREGAAIIGSIPSEVEEWARALYNAQLEDIGMARDMADEFVAVLRTSGPQIGGSSGSSDVSSGTVGAGTTIDVPSSVSQTGIIGDYTGYDYFYPKWNSGTNQRKIADKWAEAGKEWKSDIAVLDGRFIIAMRPKFGKCGDKVDVTLEDGTVMNCLLGDEKGSDAGNEWGHPYDGGKISLVEFEAKQGFRTSDVPDIWRNKKVKSVTNCGSYL